MARDEYGLRIRLDLRVASYLEYLKAVLWNSPSKGLCITSRFKLWKFDILGRAYAHQKRRTSIKKRGTGIKGGLYVEKKGVDGHLCPEDIPQIRGT